MKKFKHNFLNPQIDRAVREEIYREIDNLRQLDHRNVAKIEDLVNFENSPVVVMKLCNGSLQDFIQNNNGIQIPEKDIVSIFTQICKALEYIHEKNVIHRDLKPGNVLYQKNGDSKIWIISDFGASSNNKSQLKTSVRKVMTLSYASIEQLLEEDAQKAFDIWSLGIILY